jgi:hypothetical protein
MNRRNFILGLGTAATLSGAASVTGANLQDTVNPEADFRVIAAESLNIERNTFLDESEDANYTTTEPGSFDHNDTSATAGTNLSVNTGTDDSLALALATGNDPDEPTNNFTDGEASYVNDSNSGQINSTNTSGSTSIPTDTDAEAPLQISNETGSDRDVAVTYNGNVGDDNGGSLGSDAGSGEPVSAAEVETLFQFFVYDDDDLQQISPDGTGNDTPYSYVTVGAGETKQVHLVLNLTESISNSIQEAASASGGGFATDAEDDVDLLDTAAFGTDTS